MRQKEGEGHELDCMHPSTRQHGNGTSTGARHKCTPELYRVPGSKGTAGSNSDTKASRANPALLGRHRLIPNAVLLFAFREVLGPKARSSATSNASHSQEENNCIRHRQPTHHPRTPSPHPSTRQSRHQGSRSLAICRNTLPACAHLHHTRYRHPSSALHASSMRPPKIDTASQMVIAATSALASTGRAGWKW